MLDCYYLFFDFNIMITQNSKFYITTPIYYVNDRPHIGHAYTTIAADVLARYHRVLGNDVFFLTGTDEYGIKVAQSAKKAKKEPQEFCDEMSAYFKSVWDALNISNNDFIRTTSKRHKRGVEKFLQKLKTKNVLYKSKYEGLYCTGCEKFLTEKELKKNRCPIHKLKPDVISETNYFFKLRDYLDQIKDLIEKDEILVRPEHVKAEALGLFKQELKDFSVSRQKVKWGIEFPFDRAQTIYVWVEALQNYITAIGYADDENKFKKYWPADVHLIGRDILKFHAIYWPALLCAVGLKPPKMIFAHGFFTINGQKMSKSLGNVIDPNEMIREYGCDGTRYLLLTQFPFGQDGDIKANKFAEKYNADLANNLGNLVSRILTLHERYKTKMQRKKEMSQIQKLTENAWRELDQSINILQLDRGLRIIWQLVDFANRYIDEQKPWELARTRKEKFAEVLYNLTENLRHLAWMIQPFMPGTSNKILQQLGIFEREKNKSYKEIKKWGGLEFEIKVRKGEILFPKD